MVSKEGRGLGGEEGGGRAQQVGSGDGSVRLGLLRLLEGWLAGCGDFVVIIDSCKQLRVCGGT